MLIYRVSHEVLTRPTKFLGEKGPLSLIIKKQYILIANFNTKTQLLSRNSRTFLPIYVL